ncbi:MAG: arginase family protein [Desulfofustis sp.]|nr:arginase family protein [Desulfofustis sp.]MBT8354444.1 arginase family protein [Desulfofustis sp.]NNK56494.1 hypothetical protein [Desulfofustis sp.]
MRQTNVVGFELVELNPLEDHAHISAMIVNRIVGECFTGMAMRKMSLSEPHYLDPLATDHGN